MTDAISWTKAARRDCARYGVDEDAVEDVVAAPDEMSTAEDPLEPGRHYRFFRSRSAAGLVLEVACEVLADRLRVARVSLFAEEDLDP